MPEPWVSFVNINDRDGIGDPRTPQPETNVETLYLVNPRSGQSVSVLNLPASTDNRIYWDPTGQRVAYFRDDPAAPQTNGLYVLDLTTGVNSRILQMFSLTQRGILSTPQWSPDGSQIVIAADSGYDLDLYGMNPDGTDLRNLTVSGSFDFWPAWSPDGRSIAFVSDRAECLTWEPGSACFESEAGGATGGQLYLLDMDSGAVRQLSQERLSEPPYWITDRLVGFTTGDSFRGDNFRYLWQADIESGEARRITLQDEPDLAYYLSERWSPDGEQVVFQRAADATEITLMDASGRRLGTLSQYNFARYALHPAWSEDGSRIALGGHLGQCPHGLIVTTGNLEIVSSNNPPPTACDPVFSPDGVWIAYSGINPRVDGRLDLYVANANGYSAVNLTANLRGQIRVLGWVGG